MTVHYQVISNHIAILCFFASVYDDLDSSRVPTVTSQESLLSDQCRGD